MDAGDVERFLDAELALSDTARLHARGSSGDRPGRAGRLRLGCLPDAPLQHPQAFVRVLYEREPWLHADVVHLPALRQLAALRSGALDLALLDLDGPAPGIETELVFAGGPLSALVDRAGPLSTGRALRPVDAAGETLLVPPDSTLPMRALAAGYRFADVREVGDGDPRDVLFAVADGRGVALASHALGDLAAVVAPLTLYPPVRAPDTVLAWRQGTEAWLGPVRDLARTARAG